MSNAVLLDEYQHNLSAALGMEEWNEEEEEEGKEDEEREEQPIEEKEGEKDKMKEERGEGNEELEEEWMEEAKNNVKNVEHGDIMELDCDEDKEEMEKEV